MRQLSESLPDSIATLVLGVLVIGVLLDCSEARFVDLVSFSAGGAATWSLAIRDIRRGRLGGSGVLCIIVGHVGGDVLVMALGVPDWEFLTMAACLRNCRCLI